MSGTIGDRPPAAEQPPAAPPGDAEQWFVPFIPTESPGGPPPRGYDYAAPRRVSCYVPLLGGCLTIFALLAMAFAALAGVTMGFPAKSATTSQSVAVDANPTIVIQTSSAPVRVETGRADQVLVEERKSVRDLGREAHWSLTGIMRPGCRWSMPKVWRNCGSHRPPRSLPASGRGHATGRLRRNRRRPCS